MPPSSARQSTSERLLARLNKRDSQGIAPWDGPGNVAKKTRLKQFWIEHGAHFDAWAESSTTSPQTMRERHAADYAANLPLSNDVAVMNDLGGRALLSIRHSNPHIAATHSLILPELTLEWLCTPHKVDADSAPSPPRAGIDDMEASDSGWPPPARGLRWLFASRCTSTTLEDDAADVAAVKRSRISMASAAHRHRSCGVLASFPGLSDAQKESGFCGLGNGFAIIPGGVELARGAEVFAIGAPAMAILTAELQGKVARLDDFHWAICRQTGVYDFLLGCVDAFLAGGAGRKQVPRSPLRPPPVTTGAGAGTAAEAAAATSTQEGDAAADGALQEATAAMDLLALRAALSTHAASGSAEVVAAARAARNCAAKKARRRRRAASALQE